MTSRSTARATLLVLFSACCFGSIGVLITLATRSGARLVDLLAWRYGIAALLLAGLGGAQAMREAGQRGVRLMVIAGGGQAVIAFLSLSALRYIPVGTLTFLFYTYPAWVTVMAALRRTEALTPQRAVALGLSLCGIALMVGMPGAGGLNATGAVLALSSALLYALYIPMINHLGAGLAPAVTSSWASGGAAIVFLVAALAQGGLGVGFAPVAWGAIAALAVVSTVLAFIAFLKGLAVIGPVRTAIASTIEPFWAAMLAGLVLAQRIGPRTLAGGVLIAAAVILLQLGHRLGATQADA